ncbi:MAG: response regulator [Cyclobacteriaceae bacterium]
MMKNKKVLIVDDNPLNLRVFENVIGHNYFFETASDGLEAIEKLKNTAFDIVLMDIQMPKLDGISCLKKIREEEITDIPVIAISAYSNQGDREYFLSTGFDDFIAKPVKPKDLLETIYYHLYQKSGRKGLTQDEEGFGDLNETVIQQLLKYHSLENIKSVYFDFKEEADILSKEIKILVDLKKYEEIGEKIHILKGNSGTLGIICVYNASNDFEKELKNSNFSGLDEKLESLEESLKVFNGLINDKNLFEKYE